MNGAEYGSIRLPDDTSRITRRILLIPRMKSSLGVTPSGQAIGAGPSAGGGGAWKRSSAFEPPGPPLICGCVR